jgi:signal transduction histidine kinase
MSVISWPRRHALETLWAVFAAANVVAVVVVAEGETIPFHLIWISFAAVYTVRLWRVTHTLLALLAVMIATGASLSWAVAHSSAGLDETSEVPLMAAMFLALVWHVRRRQAAMEEVRRSAQRELRLTREREMVRDASHELRTPITVARGHAELIRSEYVGEQAADDASVILDELSRLARVSDRLLILAAVDHPGFLRRTPVELERLLVETAKRWSVTASRTWSVNAVAGGIVAADEERLESCLDALIENAVKFTIHGDSIRLALREDANAVVIEVSDSGIGIPEHELSRIFDRFTCGGAHHGGTGLGLAIVKAITEAHGGAVVVKSAVGEGTTFQLRLPGFRPSDSVAHDLTTTAAPHAPFVPA